MTGEIVIRKLTPSDDKPMAAIITQVSLDFGLTADKGYGVSDLSSESLSSLYRGENSRYWVLELNGEMIGGAGVAAVPNPEGRPACELQKMYFLSKGRGLGLGKRLCEFCLEQARQMGYELCYLETTSVLEQAYHLYRKLGFTDIDYRLGNSGHSDCEITMIKKIR